MSTTDITCGPIQAITMIETCIAMSRPICLWGSPGIGKSGMVWQTGNKLGLAVQDIRCSLLDPVDLRGLPYLKDGRSKWGVPDFLPTDGTGILFLDEINRSATMVQNACLQLVYDRRLGEYTLPDGWQIVAACNRESDGGGVSRMTSALASRFLHVNVEPSVDDWCKWAIQAGIHPLVIAFVRFRPDLLSTFDKHAKAFPTPRTWEFVSRVAGQNIPQEIELTLVSGCIGYAAAIEYCAFVKLYRALPSLDAIMLNPSGTPVPSDVATQYAVTAGLARRADGNNIGRVITYLDRLPQEFGVMGIKDAITRDSSIQATREFTNWAVKHSDVIF